MVADKWVNGGWRWSWSREISGGHNLSLLTALPSDLQLVNVSDRQDKWNCSLIADGVFTVKGVREYIDKHSILSLPIKTVWLKCLPRKVSVFWWRFKLDSLPLRWNLSTKGIDIPSIICPVMVLNINNIYFLSVRSLRKNGELFECG
ncbi:uncharacterized protein [Rutidosis leptorrhynchoides]|uniref:uncharacterized protein n=1 Tax=Rutidosis leptorrhynchoides TaxID=125765 RepID=UPI003A997C28